MGEVSGGMYMLITFMCCVCPVPILMDCASTVVSGLMRFCVTSVASVYNQWRQCIIIRIIIIYHDFLPTPRRGSHVKSGKTHTQSSRYTP